MVRQFLRKPLADRKIQGMIFMPPAEILDIQQLIDKIRSRATPRPELAQLFRGLVRILEDDISPPP